MKKSTSDDQVTREEPDAVTNGLAMLVAITSGAVVAGSQGGLQFSDTPAGQALQSALAPKQPEPLLLGQ